MSAPSNRPNRQYSRFIVAPDVWPTTTQAFAAKADAWRTAATTSSDAADMHRTAINGLRADGVAQSIGFEAMHEVYWRNQVEVDDLTQTRSAASDLMKNVAAIQQVAEQRIDALDADAHNQLAGVPRRSGAAIEILTNAAAMTRLTAVGAAEEITALSGNFVSRFGPVPESPAKQNGVDSDGGERPSPPTESQSKGTSDDFGGSGRPDAPAGQGEVRSVRDTGKSTAEIGFGDERPPVPVPRTAAGAPASPVLRNSPSGLPSFGGGRVSTGSSPLSSGGGFGTFGGGVSPSSLSTGAGSGGVPSRGSSAASLSSSPPPAGFSRALPPPASFASSAVSSLPPPSTVPAPSAPPVAASTGLSHSPVAAAPGVLQPSVNTPTAASNSSAQPAAAAPPLLPPGPMGPPPAAAPVSAAPAVAATAGTPATGAMGPCVSVGDRGSGDGDSECNVAFAGGGCGGS